MRAEWVVAVCLLSGCVAEIPAEERLDAPRPCWTRAPLPKGETPEPCAYSIPANLEDVAGIETFVKVALPAAAWKGPGTILRQKNSLLVVTTPTAHERVARLLGELARTGHGRWQLSAIEVTVSCETANTLGPLQVAGGGGEGGPLLRVPLTREATARLERLPNVTTACEPQGACGEWSLSRRILQHAYLETVVFPWETATPERGTFNPVVGIHSTGLVLGASAMPLANGNVLLAFQAQASVNLGDRVLASRAYNDWTRCPLEVPSVVRKEAEDAVVLAPGESLALVSPAPEPGKVRLLILKPQVDGT